MPCVRNMSIKECPEPSSIRGAKGLKRLLSRKMLRKRPTAIVCNTTELTSKITDFNDQDRYLIGNVCKEESSIHKY